jgi:membrane-associated phospholipid phosphatase
LKIEKSTLGLFVTGAVLCAVSFRLDDSVIVWVAAHPNPRVHAVAQFFTTWGDFPPIVGLLLLLVLIAWLMKRPFRILLMMLWCAIAGGLGANILRILTGRARPNAKVPPGWYGLTDHGHWIAGQHQYSSFPSAHTAVAIACVVPLWYFRRRAAAAPATILALCVAASRILLNAHHLSDVVVSIYLSTLISTLICYRAYSKHELR